MRLAVFCAVLAATLLPPAARAAASGEMIALEGIPGGAPATARTGRAGARACIRAWRGCPRHICGANWRCFATVFA
jgi:hypothetical protein